jgi:6-phosphofructokinase 1
MKTIAVLTSGGDSPGMNAALRAITRVARSRGVAVLGVEDGYEGLLEGRFRELNASALDRHGGQGGTLLGSARSARVRDAEGRARAAKQLEGVDGLVVIGGNGSLTGAHLLAKEHGVRVVGIPASIDNDIGCTSAAIGVDTALNAIVEACDRISDTARAHHRAFVVEVMGRQCGYLAMASAVAAGADAVLFRERGREDAEIVAQVADVVRRGFACGKRRVLVIKAEGVEIPCTKLVREVEALVGEELDGAEIGATVLGHVVRGGAPTYQEELPGAHRLLDVVAVTGSRSRRGVAARQGDPPVRDGGTRAGPRHARGAAGRPAPLRRPADRRPPVPGGDALGPRRAGRRAPGPRRPAGAGSGRAARSAAVQLRIGRDARGAGARGGGARGGGFRGGRRSPSAAGGPCAGRRRWRHGSLAHVRRSRRARRRGGARLLRGWAVVARQQTLANQRTASADARAAYDPSVRRFTREAVAGLGLNFYIQNRADAGQQDASFSISGTAEVAGQAAVGRTLQPEAPGHSTWAARCAPPRA